MEGERTGEVAIAASITGVDEVSSGFDRMGEAANRMGSKVSDSSVQMDTNYRRLLTTWAGMIANSVQLGDIIDRMASGQMDLSRGAVMLTMNFLQLASQVYALMTAEWAEAAASWAVTIAKKAEAIALGIVQALSGPWGWAILAGAAVAAAGVYALAESIPSRHYGGPIYETGPYLLSAGEYVLPEYSGRTIHIGTIIIQEARTPRETGDAVIDALRRAGNI